MTLTMHTSGMRQHAALVLSLSLSLSLCVCVCALSKPPWTAAVRGRSAWLAGGDISLRGECMCAGAGGGWHRRWVRGGAGKTQRVVTIGTQRGMQRHRRLHAATASRIDTADGGWGEGGCREVWDSEDTVRGQGNSRAHPGRGGHIVSDVLRWSHYIHTYN